MLTVDDASRRDFIAGGLSFGALWLAGCGGDDRDPATPGGDGFPVTVQHAYGETTVRSTPRRVVTIGLSDHDPVLALGVVPVALTKWFGEEPNAVWPWGQAALGDAAPEVLEGELDFEAVAALRPDLIVGTHSGITRDDYGKLTQIAPTLARGEGYEPYNVPWQVQTRAIGQALGREQRAETLVAGVEDQMRVARRALGRFDGTETVMVNGGPADGVINVYTRAGTKGRLLTDLGLDVPTDIEAEGKAFGLDQRVISLERLDLIDRDLIIWNLGEFGDRSAIEDLSVYQRLDAVRNGRDVFIEDPELYAAVLYGTVLNLPTAIAGLVPKLEDALES